MKNTWRLWIGFAWVSAAYWAWLMLWAIDEGKPAGDARNTALLYMVAGLVGIVGLRNER